MNRFIQHLTAYDARKRDEVAPACVISYNYGRFSYKGKPVRVTETALRQLCNGCGIPTDFWSNRLNVMERTPIFNRLVQDQGNVERLFRFHGDDELYGVLSPRYRRLDNILALEIMQAADDAGIGLKPVKYRLDPDHTKIRLVPVGSRVGELVPMIEVINSENGQSSLQLYAGVHKWSCENGLMIPVSDITRSRWFHIGNSDIALPDVGIVLNRSEQYVDMLNDARSRYLNPEDKERILMDIAGALGHTVAERVVDAANREYHGGRTMFDVVNATTRAAQSFRPEQQSAVERYAGHLLAA